MIDSGITMAFKRRISLNTFSCIRLENPNFEKIVILANDANDRDWTGAATERKTTKSTEKRVRMESWKENRTPGQRSNRAQCRTKRSVQAEHLTASAIPSMLCLHILSSNPHHILPPDRAEPRYTAYHPAARDPAVDYTAVCLPSATALGPLTAPFLGLSFWCVSRRSCSILAWSSGAPTSPAF
jgi:hypothetical protein